MSQASQFTIPYAQDTPRYDNYVRTIADLIGQQGQRRAAAQERSGERWGNVAGSLGDIASGYFKDREKERIAAPIRERAATMENQRIAQNQNVLDEQAKKSRLSDVVSNIASSGQAMDPKSIADNLMQNGLGEYVPNVLKDMEEMDALKNAHLKRTDYLVASALDRAKKYLGTPLEESALKQAEETLNASGIAGVSEVAAQLRSGDPSELKMKFDDIIGRSAEYLKEKKSNESPLVVPSGTQLRDRSDPTKIIADNPRATAATEASLAVQAAAGGPEGEKAKAALAVIRGQHPIAPKEEALVKVEYKGPNGETLFSYMPKSGLKGQTFEKGLGAVESNRAASAETVSRVGNDLLTRLSDPKVKDVIGPILGRYTNLREALGDPDPEFSQLAGEIESFSLANMGVHGMRSAEAAKRIATMMSAKHTPEALAGTIKGLIHFADEYMKTVGRKKADASGNKDEKPKDPLGIR